MKIEWEYDLVERAFCEQLKAMGWQWLEGDTDVPYLTDRDNFREVLLKSRLAVALRKLNLRDGKPWLDDARMARAIRDLEQAAGHRLMEINQSATALLLKEAVAGECVTQENRHADAVCSTSSARRRKRLLNDL
jgi:type I restriction enzyme R subunit